MDSQDQQKIIVVVGGVLVVILLFVVIIAFTSRRPRKPAVDHAVSSDYAASKTADSTETIRSILSKDPKLRPLTTTKPMVVSSTFTSSSIPKGGIGAFSEAELKTMLEESEKASYEIKKLQQALIMQNINDESLAQRTRELNRLRAIKPYGLGIELYKEGKYTESMRQLLLALEDPLATPVTRYMTLIYLRSAAEKEKRFSLFLEFSKIQARLAADEDLSTLGITETEFDDEWFELQNEYAKVMSDPSYEQVILQKRTARRDSSDEKVVADERTRLQNDIKRFKRHYGEFFAHVN